jgi:hypothetical protein
MNREALFQKAEDLIGRESRLIRLPPDGKVVFVGDTHGDISASREVVHRYLKAPYRIVFLGDYVDRGGQSEENIVYLLEQKVQNPEAIFLLAGNHEGYMEKEFSPANFWEGLPMEERERYGHLFSLFPLVAVSSNGIVALHGGLPDLESLEEVDGIRWGDGSWDRIVWGDFVERSGEDLGDWGGRPRFGRSYFERMMERYRKTVLIRSHQPYSPSFMFEKRCITILSSYAYLPVRTVAVADLEGDVKTGEDITIVRI